MSMTHIPRGMSSVTPYLIVDEASDLIEFLRDCFGAQEIQRQTTPNGRVMNAEVRIFGAVIEIGDSSPEFPKRPGTLHLYVEDVDTVYQRALDHGARSVYEPMDQFYGDRDSGVEDPFGNYWFIATHTRDVSPEELEKVMRDMTSGA